MSIEIIQINCMVLFKIVFMKMKVIESLWKIMKLGLKNIEIKLKIKNSIFHIYSSLHKVISMSRVHKEEKNI